MRRVGWLYKSESKGGIDEQKHELSVQMFKCSNVLAGASKHSDRTIRGGFTWVIRRGFEDGAEDVDRQYRSAHRGPCAVFVVPFFAVNTKGKCY